MSRAAILLVAGVVAAVVAGPAQAHLVETGFGAFYDGVAHVALTTSDLLVVLALALLGGQRGARAARWALFAMPAAWLAGGALGALAPTEAAWPVATTLSFGIAGALVALGGPLPPTAIAAYALVAGGVHGYVNGATMAPGGASGLALAGAVSAVFCVLALASAQLTVLRAGWTRIAVRVAGSWLAAAALLMIGWQARLAA